MCQLSCEELMFIIERKIKGNLDSSKLLGEWGLILNDGLPKSRRYTPRELARLFMVFGKKKRFIVEHQGHSYVFRQSLQSHSSSIPQKI